MEEIFNEIVASANESKKEQDSFHLPTIKDHEVEQNDYASGGATLFGRKWVVKNDKETITVTYESKDKCRVHQIKPDLNIVKAKWEKDGEIVKEFSDSWEDKY